MNTNGNARKRPRPESNREEGFIAAATFQGSRPGYVFRHGPQGTGYYLDDDDDNITDAKPSAAPARKGVRISEDRNETRVIPSSAEALLARAEAASSSSSSSAGGGGGGLVLDLAHPSTTLPGRLTAWHRAVQANALQRAQYADDPTQYMESEVQLYEHVRAWKALAADPATLYPFLLTAGKHNHGSDNRSSVDPAADVLGPLLQHVNTDVSRVTLSVLVEWLDPTLLLINEEEDDNDDRRGGETGIVTAVQQLAALVLEEGLLDLAVANLGRLAAEDDDKVNNVTTTDDDDDVGKGVWDILQLVEHFIDMESTLQANNGSTIAKDTSVALYLAKQTTLLGWLFQAVEKDEPYGERALEILVLLAPLEDVYTGCPDWTRIPPYTSILMEDDEGEDKGTAPEAKEPVDAMEILLQRVGKFRKTQPDATQVDALENAALVLHSILTYNSETHVAAFVQAQGIELVIRCLKERVHAAGVTLKWLDVPGSDSPVHREACEHMVTAGLLKYLLPLWMGRALPVQANTTGKPTRAWRHSMEQTVIRLVYALTRHLTPDSPADALSRLVAKFAADEAKLQRLVHYLTLYDQKARTAEYKFYRSDVEDMVGDEEAVSLAALETKLSGGGDLFHRLGAICAFLCVQSKQCHTVILKELQAKDAGMGLVRAAVQEFASIVEPSQRQQLEGYLEAL